MSRGDGKNPKFRILCKRCNSYQHTVFNHIWDDALGINVGICITCRKCLNTANDFDEEWPNE
jgi:hypothetical protein